MALKMLCFNCSGLNESISKPRVDISLSPNGQKTNSNLNLNWYFVDSQIMMITIGYRIADFHSLPTDMYNCIF